MSNNVTDRILLKRVYKIYYNSFCSRQGSDEGAVSQIYVPIDCEEIGRSLKMNSQIVFGRLYYHLDKKHRYRQDDESLVHLFALKVGEERHCVNFPLLSAVLAELEQSYYRFTVPIAISLFALLVSVGGIIYGCA